MAEGSRWNALASRIAWLCLLAAIFGGQLVFWQDSTDPFAPVEAFWFKVFLSLGIVPLLGARWSALLAFLKSWPARAALAWMAWLWASALFITPADYHPDAMKTALEYSWYSLPFFAAAVSTGAERRALWAALLFGSLVAAAYGFGQHFEIDPWRWSTNFAGRPLGTIGNPNFFGGHLLLAWGLALAAFLEAEPSKRRRWAAALGLLLAVLFFTLTVGVWVGVAFSLAAAWAFSAAVHTERRRQLFRATAIGAVALAALLAVAFATPWGSARYARFKESKGLSVVNRQMMWKVAIKLWHQAPVQGAGLCTYRPLYPKLQAEILAAEPDKGWNYVVTWLPHQNYLYWLSETGLIGLALFLGWWGLSAAVAWRRAVEGEAEVLGPLLALAGLCGAGFLNTFSNIPPTAVGSALCLGFLAAPAVVVAQQRHRASLAAPAEAWAIAIILALLLGRAGGLELVANRLTRQGGRAEKAKDPASAALYYGKAAGLGIANFTEQSLVGVHFNHAENLRALGLVPEAIEAYKRDMVANPWAPESQNMLGASLGQYGSMTRRGDLVLEGIGYLKTAAWVNPGYTTALINLGGSYMTLGNLSGAAEAWTEALKYEPNNAEAAGYLRMLKVKR